MGPRDAALLTDIYDPASLFLPEPNALYLFGTSVEERSFQDGRWRRTAKSVTFCELRQEVDDPNTVTTDQFGTFGLRSERQLADFFVQAAPRSVYLDVTGLSHSVWAPVLKAALNLPFTTRVVYREPAHYNWSASPTEGQIFDLSTEITGIAPLPGFALLSRPTDKGTFIPLLGFEGARFAYVLEQIQPVGASTFPVIGVPGFRPEFAFHAFLGNRAPLKESGSWRNIRFAEANDPFSAYYALEEIVALNPSDLVRIAPVGTKPHAIAAVLLALSAPRHVELVYDHPIRKPKRTMGIARALVYEVSPFSPSTLSR
jgi:hypothetical protein